MPGLVSKVCCGFRKRKCRQNAQLNEHLLVQTDKLVNRAVSTGTDQEDDGGTGRRAQEVPQYHMWLRAWNLETPHLGCAQHQHLPHPGDSVEQLLPS